MNAIHELVDGDLVWSSLVMDYLCYVVKQPGDVALKHHELHHYAAPVRHQSTLFDD
jgi:hypothetical protein